MLSLTRTLRGQIPRIPQVQSSLVYTKRSFAEVVNVTQSSTEEVAVATSSSLRAVDWRKERVPVKEDHGLYAFFRRKEPQVGEKLEGEDKYEVFEPPQIMEVVSGRGWKSEELRLKSFKDLHVLWYVLLRERNLLATQKEEVRRMGVQTRSHQVNITKVYHVRKSMARIKQVLNERRVAYEKACGISSAEHEAYHNSKVFEHLESLRAKAQVRTHKSRVRRVAARAERARAEVLAMRAKAKAEAKARAEAQSTLEAKGKSGSVKSLKKRRVVRRRQIRSMPTTTPRKEAGATALAGLFGRNGQS